MIGSVLLSSQALLRRYIFDPRAIDEFGDDNFRIGTSRNPVWPEPARTSCAVGGSELARPGRDSRRPVDPPAFVLRCEPCRPDISRRARRLGTAASLRAGHQLRRQLTHPGSGREVLRDGGGVDQEATVQCYEFMQDYRVHVETKEKYIAKHYFSLPGTIAESSIAKSCLSCLRKHALSKLKTTIAALHCLV